MCQMRIKLVVKWHFTWADGTGIWLLSECYTRILLEECNAILERGDRLKPRVINDSLNDSCSDWVVGIGNVCHIEDVIPKGIPSKYLRLHLDLSRRKVSYSDRSYIEKQEMARAWCPSCLQYWSLLMVTNVRERLSVGKVATQALIWRDSIWRS